MPPLMEGEALAARVLEMGPISAKFLGPVILEVPHYASLRGKEREIVILRSDNGSSWREHNTDATDDVVQDILNETLEIEDTSEEEKSWEAARVTRILTHDFPQYFAVISRIRQEVHAIGPEGGMVSSSVVPQVQAVFPQGALTKKIKVGLQAQIIDSELTAKLLGRGVAVSPVVTVEPRRRKFHKAITLSMPAPRPHTQGMTNQYSTSSAPTLRLLCSISGGTNRAHWEDVTENTPLTFVNDCVSFTTTVSARYWLIDCRHIEDATKMATELYREAIHVPFMARFVVYAKRTDETQAQLRMFCVTDDKEEKALERIERFIQVAKSRDVEVHEGKPIYLEFGGNLVPVAKSGEQLSIPFRAFRENRVAFPVMIKTQDLEPICRCQFMRDPKVPKGEPSPTPIATLNIMVPDDIPAERISPVQSDTLPRRTEEQERIWRQRLNDPRLEDICNLLGKDWVALAYELGVSVATVNQIQAKRITTSEQAQLMLKLWKTQSGTKAQDNSLELALCRIGRDDIIAPQSEITNERRIQRNIYQERQASEEIEAYKAEEDNKLKDTMDSSQISERTHTEDMDQDEAKYSPEEKSFIDKSEMERTPTPSEESEEDEDVKRSVAERKQQITKKLSSSKIPASKQKKEIREEIIEIKTQIKPDIKKFQDIEQQVKEKEPKLERTRSKTSPETIELEEQGESEVIVEKKEEMKEHKVEQFRKFDPSSPAKPTPKHLQRHMRNESMRFPSGDFSNITITPKKSMTTETVVREKKESFSREVISQKEIERARLEEKLDDGERSPDLVEEKDVAEATLKDKISVFETKITKEPEIVPAKTIKLTKEALKKHTMEHEQSVEYTQEFIREQAKQMEAESVIQKVDLETTKHTEVVKTVKETIQQFDSKIKKDDKTKSFTKSARTDSTIVQVSSEEDNEFLKKSTDSETETESQTTVKAEKDRIRKTDLDKQVFHPTTTLKHKLDKKDDQDKKNDDDDRRDQQPIFIKEKRIEKQLTDELRSKVSEEEITETLEEKDVSLDESKERVTSTKSETIKTITDSGELGAREEEQIVMQESPLPSAAEKADSLGDLQQSTEKDISFISQTESKVYSKHRSDSLDETSQFSDLEDQIGMSPAHKPTLGKQIEEPEDVIAAIKIESARAQTQEFLQYETEYTSRNQIALGQKEADKIPPKESPVISAKARHFIETVPEDDSVQECFFSKRIYSDSLEDSEHTDSRRHSEADSLKSDQSDMKAKVSSSDFDERAEYEATADSGSGFGDEKFEESVGFTSIRIESKQLDSDKQSTSTSEEKEVDVVFKKMTPKRHSRTDSVSISKLSDLITDTEPLKIKQEFQMIVTEAEEIDKSFEKDEISDKISSESSREIEISDRKSSEGVSDRISSEDAVTDKKTSSEEEVQKDSEQALETTKSVKDMIKNFENTKTSHKDEYIDKDLKRQSVASVESGSISELRLDEKRPSDARSLTESKDYTFEESEDDIRTQGTHVELIERFDAKEPDSKTSHEGKEETPKVPKLIHGDSLDDVEGFPEDHVADYIHKLPHIAEVSADKMITSQFLSKERGEQVHMETKDDKKYVGISDRTEDFKSDFVHELENKSREPESTSDLLDESKETKLEEKIGPEGERITVTTETSVVSSQDGEELKSFKKDDKVKRTSTATETIVKPEGETVTTTTVIETFDTPEGEITKKTVTEKTVYPSGRETISTKVSESMKCFIQKVISEEEDIKASVTEISPLSKVTESRKTEKKFEKQEDSVYEPKFDVTKIRTDTLSKLEIAEAMGDEKDLKKAVPSDLTLRDLSDITKEQIKPVIDDILQKGTIAAATKSPTSEKDFKVKETVELEKRNYDAKVPHKEERRHSCVSPAISLERIAESEIEAEEDILRLTKIPSFVQKDSARIELKKSDSTMKQMADNIEIIIKQASEEVDMSSEEPVFDCDVSPDIKSNIEDNETTYAVTVGKKEDKFKRDINKDISLEDTKVIKERPALMKSLSRDSGEVVIMPKKKHVRTFSVQSSPEEVEEQIYTDSESDMDKAKVLEIIEPTSDMECKVISTSFDTRKIRTDSLDDADDFPEKEGDFFEEGKPLSEPVHFGENNLQKKSQEPGSSGNQGTTVEKQTDKFVKKTHFVDSIMRSDLISKSTTESSVTTVISTLTKSSEEDQKSVLEEGTSGDFSKLSGADLMKDSSRASLDHKEEDKVEEHFEDRATPDLSKKSLDLTKDYSKSSIDSKDTSRDFATNELSKDSTVDLTKDFSKTSIDSVKETSRSLEEKTFSEDHSSMDASKTLASDASDGITVSKDFIEEERSFSKGQHVLSSSSHETSLMTESKFLSDLDDTSVGKTRTFDTEKNPEVTETDENLKAQGEKTSLTLDGHNIVTSKEEKVTEIVSKEEEIESRDMTELNRRCSSLLEDISTQGALIRIDASHITHDLVTKLSKTPPPSPVDLIMRDKTKPGDGCGDKQSGLQLTGSEPYLDASRQSPRASSGGDSLISETDAHQSDILSEASKVLRTAAIPKSPTKHLADNMAFVNVDQPTITSGAKDLVDRTIEKSIDVIDQIKKEQLAVKMEELQRSTSSDTFYKESRVETSTSSSSVHKTVEGSQLVFQSIDPNAVMSDMISKFGTLSEHGTVLSHKETETTKISGQEYFSETKQVSSSDDDSLIIKTQRSHELRGQEHEIKEKMTIRKDGDQTETSQKKMERAHEATAKRSDIETKTVIKSTDDTDIVKVEREFLEQGLYSGRQTKSEERMTALKDDTVKKKHEIKISERDLSHEQWGKEYFTQPGELEDIHEVDDSKIKAFVDTSLKIIEKDEVVSTVEVSEKGKVVSSKVEHHKDESVIESKEHDDLSSDVSHTHSFKSESAERRSSTEESPKSKSKSFKKEDETYEVNFIKEIKISTSPVKSSFSRTGSQDTHSESEVAPELPQDADTPKKEKLLKSPVKIPQHQIEEQILEVSFKNSEEGDVIIDKSKSTVFQSIDSTITKSSDSDTVLEIKPTELKTDLTSKTDIISPSTLEGSEEISTSRDIMVKSADSVDTECMIKSLESHEAEILQKSMDSTVSAETLHPSEFSTEADSAFLTGTGTDPKKEEMKLTKEKSTEDICSSGYDTDLSSAEFQAAKQEKEKIDLDSLISTQPFTDLSVLEKTIDEVKQSLEAAQGEIISEKSDGSIKYKQSPSEFQFKILISPDRPEVITEEPLAIEDLSKSLRQIEREDKSQISESISQKISSQEEISLSDTDLKDTVHIKESSPPLDVDTSIKSDSGPHSILETESEIFSDRELSSKGSPEVKLRVQKHIKTKLGVGERRSASDIEGWSSSGESHYHSFEHSESRPLSSDIEVMMTAQSGTEFETALTSHDVSSQSLRTSKDYYTACSSLASRDSVKSLDSDGSSHIASIDISDASETLVPSANELKEELMESSTYIEQFLHETEKDKKICDVEVSGDEEDYKEDAVEPISKMKRSHEMRFQPKDMIPEHFPLTTTSESTEFDEDSLKDKEISDTTISSQLKTDEILSSSISKVDMSSSKSQLDLNKEEIIETVIKASSRSDHTVPFSVTKIERPQREFVDVDSQIIPVGSVEYKEIEQFGSIITDSTTKTFKNETVIEKTILSSESSVPMKNETLPEVEVKEVFVKKTVHEIEAVPFPITDKPTRLREFVDIEEDIIPVGSKQYEEILKSKSDSSVPKTKAEKSVIISEEGKLDSKPSSSSSLKTQEHMSTPHTPLSAPSQSSISTDNGREYILDDIYDISETPELKSEIFTESSKSELLVTTDDRTLRHFEKDQDSPTSDEFEIVDKPSEIDDFVVIEEVAKEAQETDPEGKSLQIKAQKYVARHDTEVEEYLTKASKKQESTSSTSGSSDDDMQYEMEQRKLKAQELAEIEAGKRWIQMQFEGDPRYDYERIPLEDIKEEEMTDFDASRIGSLSSQKESIGSYGSFRNSYGSLSESEMASRMRFRIKGENDDISISSLQEFENLERALMEQYQQNSSSSQDSLNGSLPRRYVLSKSQGEEIEISSLKEFEGLESACLEALKAELLAKQKEALLLADPKVVSGSFLEQEKRSYDSSSDSSPPIKSGSPSQKSGSPSQKSGSPSQKSGSPSQRVGSYGSPSQKLLADSAAIRKLIDQQLALEQRMQESRPKIVTVKKYDDKGAYFVPVPEPEISETKSVEVTEECKKTSSFVCAAAPSDGSAESIPGDCEEMMKILDQEEKTKDRNQALFDGRTTEVVKMTTVITQRFVDGKKISETVSGLEGSGGVDIPARITHYDETGMSLSSEMSSSLASQPSELDSLMTVVERQNTEDEIVSFSRQTLTLSAERPEDLDFSREGSVIRELSPSSGRSVAHSIVSGKHFTDPASGSWSAQDEELSSSGSFSRARADLMLGSTDSLEATSSNATRATYNYEVDTPMTGSLTSGAVPPLGSNTMVSSLDTLDPVTAVQMESLEHQSMSEHCSQFEVHEPDSDTERLELDGRIPKTKERTIMFDSTDTLSAVSADNSVREATIEGPAATFYIGDTPILRGERRDEEDQPTTLSGSCPASLPPTTQSPTPIPAQRSCYCLSHPQNKTEK
ncbi:unnamed protein product [Leptosia nina]|uniref:Ankyrin-2 n=1 Tax=Leptosia nina TaxID=320188 RepID=A0AAV1JDY7_9NEOP